jgi:hypothetical protein
MALPYKGSTRFPGGSASHRGHPGPHQSKARLHFGPLHNVRTREKTPDPFVFYLWRCLRESALQL